MKFYVQRHAQQHVKHNYEVLAESPADALESFSPASAHRRLGFELGGEVVGSPVEALLMSGPPADELDLLDADPLPVDYLEEINEPMRRYVERGIERFGNDKLLLSIAAHLLEAGEDYEEAAAYPDLTRQSIRVAKEIQRLVTTGRMRC